MLRPDSVKRPLSRVRRIGALCLSVLLLPSCADVGPSESGLDEYLTESARGSLGADGRFAFADPPFIGGRAWTNVGDATGIAALYPPTFLNLSAQFSDEHEARLTPDGVGLCDRVFFAESVVDTLPRDWDAASSHRQFGAMRLFQFCKGGRPAMLVGVSVFADPLRAVNGNLVFPENGAGGELQAAGAPRRWRSAMGASPEEAVEIAAKCVGRKINKAPQLIRLFDQAVHAAPWRLELDSSAAITVRGAGAARRRVDIVYVSQWFYKEPGRAWPSPTVLVAAENQPDSVAFSRAVYDDPIGNPGNFRVVTSWAFRRQGLPVKLEVVECPSGQ